MGLGKYLDHIGKRYSEVAPGIDATQLKDQLLWRGIFSVGERNALVTDGSCGLVGGTDENQNMYKVRKRKETYRILRSN